MPAPGGGTWLGGVPAPRGASSSRGMPALGGCLVGGVPAPGGCVCSRGCLLRGCLVRGVPAPGGVVENPQPADGYCGGRHASY